jgi:hypothetical protein
MCSAARRLGGPQTFLALRQHFSIFNIAERILALLEEDDDVSDPQAELSMLRYWLGVDRFDRRALNRHLRQDAGEHATIPTASAEVQA